MRLPTVALALLLGATLAPGLATAKPAKTRWTTTYTGKTAQYYEWHGVNNFTGESFATEEVAQYAWTAVEREDLIPSHGKVKASRTLVTHAYGFHRYHTTEDPSKNHDCSFSLDSSPIKGTPSNGFIPKTARDNPLLIVEWRIPYTTSTDPGCEGWSPSFAPAGLPGLTGQGEAVIGSANVRFKDLPFHKNFYDSRQHSATDDAGIKYTGRVFLDSHVKFNHGGEQDDPDKLGNLLLKDAVKILAVEAADAGARSSVATGEPEPIPVPGLPSDGTVTFEVNGDLAPGPPRMARAAAAPTVLATVTRKLKAQVGAVLILAPTDAGRSFLAAPRPARRVTITATFDPKGPKRRLSKSRTVTLPALS
jgi:hypothetical protein